MKRVDESVSEQQPQETDLPPVGKHRRSICRRILIRGLLLIAVTVVVLFFYTLWFLAGEPAPSVDYVAQLNQMNLPQNQNPEDNAWPHYERAFSSFVRPEP